MSNRTCVLEIALIGTAITIRHPTMDNHKENQHIRLPDDDDYLTPQPRKQAKPISNEPNSVNEHPTKKLSEIEEQATSQLTRTSTIIHPGIIYKLGMVTYKFYQPVNQELITMDNQQYLTIGTTLEKGSHRRQQILIALETLPKDPKD